jgi:hypothetical protein
MDTRLEVGDFVVNKKEPYSIGGQINSISPYYESAFVVYPIGRPYIFPLIDLELIQRGTLSHFSWDLAQEFINLLEKDRVE